MKIENRKLKMKILVSFSALALAFGLSSCEQLQNTLSSEQEEQQAEDTGIASINGDTWYFDGIGTTDFSKTEGASLAVTFNRKVVIGATKEVSNEGDVSYTSNLTGFLTATFTTPVKQEVSLSYPIKEGKITLADGMSISAGELSADGKTFRLNMKTVASLLDSDTAYTFIGDSVKTKNELSLAVNLSGFVCPSGTQKGRAVGTLKKNLSVKQLYEDSVVKSGVIFYTLDSTVGKSIVIPTQGKVSLADGATCVFSSPDANAPSDLTSDDFSLAIGESGENFVITCNKELKGKNFIGSFTISGFIPDLNASSYTRTFTVSFAEMTSSSDTLSATTDTGDSANNTSKDMYSSDIESLSVSNDGENLYVMLSFSNPPSLWNKDNITILFDNASDEGSGVFSETVNWDSTTGARRGIGTKSSLADGSSIEGQLTTFAQVNDTKGSELLKGVVQFDYANGEKTKWTQFGEDGSQDASQKEVALTDMAGEDIKITYNSPLSYLFSFSSSTLKYTIPLEDLNLSVGDSVYVYAAVTHHNDDNDYGSIADHAPAKTATNSDGSAISAAWTSGKEDYKIDMSAALKHVIKSE